ncbi:hypothetical protein BCR41DRAFT_401425 [Lobosporangium transversale]|uniref:Uncharacterized protein n=1 Tax=Lobosporangium transversale TaxID=64571 RepID=A0A1Y2G995_9FUNG|nr:hypothetical protein BCR41DRAFT_401425 [Lobosporangium transversale]ORZ01954.1 hypothetical protein BCR41DRAFT_401425 [Lobosporangium transversale]|eukprot:XP_021876207.1 hypothetical protein BCR41DRAFT_401425 [Lobosporangium transversale]
MPILNHHSLPETYKEMCEVARKYDQTRLTVAAGKYRHPTLLKNEGNQAERIFQQLNDLSINLLETTRTMNEMIQDQQRNIHARTDNRQRTTERTGSPELPMLGLAKAKSESQELDLAMKGLRRTIAMPVDFSTLSSPREAHTQQCHQHAHEHPRSET